MEKSEHEHESRSRECLWSLDTDRFPSRFQISFEEQIDLRSFTFGLSNFFAISQQYLHSFPGLSTLCSVVVSLILSVSHSRIQDIDWL